ncbi:glycosyltransferase [Streptomyces hoynatensis]|uniref:D-inositol 3-phosphate glycosyltransferase n=1 Tax=Streptomyces hoynatensis TaxID=1141874 RepID=A0A3A9YV55_9ACTN|nr:glycosyltransferase [Streptomyces hoynatensis]RKN39830.1 glycosyltransferase [Streptomyces hoynatensis]
MRGRNIFLAGIDVDSMGGSQRVLHTLAQGFAERGHRVRLIGIRPSPQPHRFHAEPAYRHATLYSRPASPPWRPRTFAERLDPRAIRARRALRADRERARRRMAALFAEAPEGYLIIGSPWAADWLRGMPWPPGLRGIGQYHESYAQARSSANLRLILRHYPALEKAVFLSEPDAEEFRRQRLPNAGVIPNPLPFPAGSAAPLDTGRIGAVGRLDAVKRLDRLIDAFADTGPLPGWELHLFGEGPLEGELRAHAARRGLGDLVRFRGAVGDMAAAYRELSVLALTSEREGRPMALAEAAAAGVPAVGFDLSGGVRELVADGRTGTLVPPHDTAALGRALARLMADGALRERYGAAAREHVRPLATPAVLDRWEELFAEIDR